ncbi:hypothetical protein N4G70_35780 [Streptomyces sp. ASQP_92]|uniref:hypothetical protein n=1 Tax=Streptomyces sp. ASQP_92 TaxID=2979116 RepID=UPI0021C04696|nr:hypothetical protein [Streptomyces sp. ASQP_92]MCT9094166.1 hypothetical protein [Streptomyces sp. ASQP_92]
MACKIVFGDSVERFIRELPDSELDTLASDIRQISTGGPPFPGAQAPKEHWLVVLGCGYTMLYREMASDELKGNSVRRGFVVVELQSASDSRQP